MSFYRGLCEINGNWKHGSIPFTAVGQATIFVAEYNQSHDRG